MNMSMERAANEMARLAALLNEQHHSPSVVRGLIASMYRTSMDYLDAQSQAFKEGLKK